MKRRKFVQSSFVAASAFTAKQFVNINNDGAKQSVFELREYEMRFGTSENDLHNYFKQALIPAFNRYDVKAVGVFKEYSRSEPTKLYVLIVYQSWETYLAVNAKIKADPQFLNAAASYTNLAPAKVPFARYSTKLMVAFDGMPQVSIPANAQRIFELRTYESAGEHLLAQKIKMFNVEEFRIFDRTHLNRVFFGEVIAGKDLPCLTYMLTFSSMEERDKNWAAFSADPDWKRVSALPEYTDTVSRITKIFLEPLPYSQI